LKNTDSKEVGDTADTAEMIAQKHGVSRETVKRAGKFAVAMDRISHVSPVAEAKIMSGEAKGIINKSDIRNLAEAPEAEIKKVAKAIEKDKPVKTAKTTEKETSVQHVHKAIDEIEHRVDILTEVLEKFAESRGQLSDDERSDISKRIDGLSGKVQFARQTFL